MKTNSAQRSLYNYIIGAGIQIDDHHRENGNLDSFRDALKIIAFEKCTGKYPSKLIAEKIVEAAQWIWDNPRELRQEWARDDQSRKSKKRWGDSTEAQAAAIRMYDSGMNKTEIAKSLGFSRKCITDWLRDAGRVKTRSKKK